MWTETISLYNLNEMTVQIFSCFNGLMWISTVLSLIWRASCVFFQSLSGYMTPVGSEMAALSEMRRVNSLFLSLFLSRSFITCISISSVRISNPKYLIDETVVIHNTSREPLTSYHERNPNILPKNLLFLFIHVSMLLMFYAVIHWLKSGNNVQVMGR